MKPDQTPQSAAIRQLEDELEAAYKRIEELERQESSCKAAMQLQAELIVQMALCRNIEMRACAALQRAGFMMECREGES